MSEYCNNCFCCGYYLVPRYKRLVNNIFSQNPQVDILFNKLLFFSFLLLCSCSMVWIKIISNDYVSMLFLNQKNLKNHFDICLKK